MLQVKDIRDSRVYREAKEEGFKEGTARAIVILAAKKMPIEEIVAIFEVNNEFVHQVLNSQTNG